MFAQHEGAIAAPTAGLHFTRELVQALAGKGIELAQVTLHVGPGTFRSVKTERIEDHRMLAERIEVSAQTVAQIRRTRERGTSCGGSGHNGRTRPGDRGARRARD
jgi:S-adenosylmethionine:tRNA ribosyltransferase-isomerase